MLEIKKILVAKDFSPCAEMALHHAAKLAQTTGAELHVLYVQVLYEDHFEAPAVPAATTDELLEKLRSRTEEGWDKKDESPVCPVVFSVERDIAAAPAIVSYARENDMDIVFMGTHGRRGLRHLLMGSVAEEVVRTAPCKVITIARCDETHENVRSILVPVDFSTHAGEALRTAVQFAEHFGARIDLLHVVEETLHPAFYNTGVFSIYDVEPDIEGRSKAHLEQLYEPYKSAKIKAEFHVRSGRAASEITHFAKEHGHDLIVMSTHGLTGLAHLLIGSVSEKVVRSAPCSVLTVKRSDSGSVADGPARYEEEAL